MYRSILFSTTFLLLLVVFGLFPALAQGKRIQIGIEDNESRIFSLVNRERTRSGLPSLEWSARLADLARSYSGKMAREGFFDHIDGNGESVVDRARHSHISGWSKIGENLFECEPTNELPGLAVRGWMRSATHRENILDPDWQATGIGIALDKNGEIYITEVFAAG